MAISISAFGGLFGRSIVCVSFVKFSCTIESYAILINAVNMISCKGICLILLWM